MDKKIDIIIAIDAINQFKKIKNLRNIPLKKRVL
jgi:hypothetical protein